MHTNAAINPMPAESSHRHALIIGVNHVADPHLAPLASAERDARALAAALEAPACGFTVTLLLAEQATAAAVRDRLIDLVATPSVDLIVIFCGHGVSLALSSDGNETFLATSDFRGDVARRDPTRFLSLRWLYEQVYVVAEPRSAIAVLDCCFAGDIAHAGKDALTIDLRAAIEQYRQQQRQLYPANRLRAIIAATGPHQKVAETATGGALAQALLAVLRGDKLLAEGEITIGHLDDHLKRHFAGQEQQPYTKIEGNYRLILANHRDRVAAQRAAAKQQRHDTATKDMLAPWRNHDSLGRAAELQRDFVGRAAELAAIQAHIEQLRPTGGYLLVTGVAGQGKSSVLASLRQTTDPPLPAYFIRFTPGLQEQAALLGHLIAELLEQHGLAEEALTYLASDTSAITLRNSLTSLLDRLARRQPLTLIIDGLDQIPVQRDLGQRDLSFLPERLPAGVVIVIGTRPDDTLVPLTLQTQHHEYKLPPLSLSDFALLLEQRGVSLSEADCRALHSALHGNAFDLAFLATELQREASASDVQALIRRVIANPRDIFRPTIERLKREPDWDNVIEPALGVLLSAQEPLSAPALASILAQKYHRVQDVITRLRGLLGERDREGQPRYYLLHLKLIEHLKSEIFAGDLTAYHDQLARWCEGDLALDSKPAQDSNEAERRAYAQTHLVYHLAHAQAYERLWAILDADDYGAAKRRADPSLRRYTLDLDLARSAVVSAAGGDTAALARSLPRLWQYSLLRCTLSSQIDNWPTALFTALVALGRSAEARDGAELLSNPARRAEALLAIGHALLERGESEEAKKVWQDVYRVVNTVLTHADHTDDFDKTLRDIATVLTQIEQYEVACDVTKKIACPTERTIAFSAIAAALVKAGRATESDNVFTEARAAAEAIKVGSYKVIALSSLATAFTQAGRIEDANTTFADALNTEATSEYDAHHIQALGTLAAAFAQAGRTEEANCAFAKACTAAKTIPESYVQQRVAALTALAVALAQAGRKEEANWAFAEACIAAKAIPKLDWNSAKTLTTLAAALAQFGHTDEETTRILADAYAAANDGEVDYWPRTLNLYTLATALARACKFSDAHNVTEAAHNVTEAIKDVQFRSDALSVLAAALAQAGRTKEADSFFAKARAAAETIENDRDYVSTLSVFAAALAQAGREEEANSVFTKASAAAEAISELSDRTATLGTLAAAFAQAGRTEEANCAFAKACTAAETISKSDWNRADALITLAAALAQAGQYEKARSVAEAIDDSHRARTLRTLAATQAAALARNGQHEAARDVAKDISYPDARTEAFSTLATALALAGHTIEANRTFAEASTAARAVEDDARRAEVLSTLATALALAGRATEANRTFAEASTAAKTIEDHAHRADALRALATALAKAGRTAEANDAFAEARTAAKDIPNLHTRAEVLHDLATALTQAGRIDDAVQLLAEAWQRAQHRDELLTLFAVKAELIQAYPEIGAGLVQAFAWVEEMARRSS